MRTLPRSRRQRGVRAAVVALVCAAGAPVGAEPVVDRGRLLYETHCIACHTTQMHWRDRRVAKDWTSLVAQVARWQAEAQLGWTAADIDAVARHLNDTIYHHDRPRRRAQRPGGPDAG